MELRITDLLDEYMYDDIPLDEMPAEDHGAPAGHKSAVKGKDHRRWGQIAAAIVIVISVAAAGTFYFGGDTGQTGDSLGPGVEEASDLETESERTSENTEFEESAIETDVTYEIVETPEEAMDETAVEDPVMVFEEPIEPIYEWEVTEKIYSLMVSVAPGYDAEVPGEFSLENIQITEESLTFTLHSYDAEEISVVGSKEQMLLGAAAEPEIQFYVVEAVNSSGETVTVMNPRNTDGGYIFTAAWTEKVDPDEIKAIVLKKQNKES